MIMRICPNCLVGVERERYFCHQCGHSMSKPQPVKKVRKLVKKGAWGGFFRSTLDVAILFTLLAIGYLSVM